MNTRLLFGLLWLTSTLCFGALSTDTSYFLNVEALTNVTARSAVRGLTGVFTNGVTSASLTSTGYVQSPVPYSNPIPALATPVAASEINTATYDAFPSMVMTPSGKLVVIYRVGTSHVGPGDFGVMTMRTSTDIGKTWSSATTIQSVASRDVRNYAVGIGRDGSIIVAYAIYNPATSAFESMAVFKSTDDGVTWSTPVALSSNSETTFSPYGSIIQIGDSKIGFGWFGSTTTVYTTYFVTSSDSGLTWSAPVTVATATGGARWTEASYAYVGGSGIVGLVRDDVGTVFTQYKSTDNGATWSSQGAITFDSWSAPGPARLVPYLADENLMIACYYQDRTEGKARVVYGSAFSLFNTGVSGWIAASRNDIGNLTGTGAGGYLSAVHPYGTSLAVVSWYNEKSASDADLTFAAVTATQLGPMTLYQDTSTTGLSLFTLVPSENGGFKIYDNATTGFLPAFEFSSTNVTGYGGLIVGRVPTASDTLAALGAAVVLNARRGPTGADAVTGANVLQVWNGATQVMTIDKDGEVGFGTASISGATSTLQVGGSHAHSIATGTAATLGGTNEVYLVNVDAQTVTLPTAVGINGRTYTVKAIAPCTVATVATTSSQLIDGATTYSLSASNKFVRVISDNARWWIIGNN